MDNISSETHYEKALERVWQLMQQRPQKNTPEGAELDMLATLIEAYEAVYYPMQPTDSLAFLKYKMEKENIKQKDLIPYIGDKSKVSKVLNGKQELTLSMIQKLSRGLKIPVTLLVSA